MNPLSRRSFIATGVGAAVAAALAGPLAIVQGKVPKPTPTPKPTKTPKPTATPHPSPSPTPGGSSVPFETHVNVQQFLQPGTWVKPVDVGIVEIHVIAAGSGGHAGNKSSGTPVPAAGGAGGGAGAYSVRRYDARSLPDTLDVHMPDFSDPLQSAGAAGQMTDSTSGDAGTAGGDAWVGDAATTYCYAQGGPNGGSVNAKGTFVGGQGGQGGVVPGGGQGGACSASTEFDGHDGIVPDEFQGWTPPAAGVAPGGNGTPGNSGGASPMPGSSGAGGAGALLGPAGAGGDGSFGAGGGGGGGSINGAGNTSGAGGRGGPPLCVIFSW